MILNELGYVCGGIGDTGVAAGIDGVYRHLIPQRGGGTSWFNNSTVIYQTYAWESDGHAVLEMQDVYTDKRWRVSERGANHICAGGGKWAAWLGGGPGTGVYGDVQTEVGFVPECGRDGTFIVYDSYQENLAVRLFAPDGRQTILPVTSHEMFGPIVLGPDSALWTHPKTGLIQTLNSRVPKQIAPAGRVRVCKVDGEEWVMYWGRVETTEGIVLHPYDELSGYILYMGDRAYNHDMISLNGKIRVTWSATQGERPQDMVVFDKDLNDERTNFVKSGSIFIDAKEPELRTFTQFSSGGVAVANGSTIIHPQLGLLEDDIVYRLALLATNILQPLKAVYPNIIIKSGFRQVNSGVSQHELGEAVDLQINNQTPELLYEVANWMQNNLAFDQIVLNYTNIGDGQPWIHVSFSPKSLRGQVATKDYADTFHEGLYFIEQMSGEEAAAAAREQAELDTRILAEMDKMQKRNVKMLPVSSVMDEIQTTISGQAARDASGITGEGSGGSGTGGSDNGGRAGLVSCVQNALALQGGDHEHNIAIAFEVIKRVAWLLRDEGCGLLIGPSGGDNISSWNGYTFRAGRVCYPDGQIYKLLTGVEDGPPEFHRPGWVDEGMVEQSLYVPAMDPGTDINLNWMQCPLPKPEETDEPGGTPGTPVVPGIGGSEENPNERRNQ